MTKDIVPELLEKIQSEFKSKTAKSKVLKKKILALQSQKVTHKDSNEFAIELGKILVDTFKGEITENVLPDGKMYYNIAKRLIEPNMKNNHDLVSDYSRNVQDVLNKEFNISLKAIKPQLNQNRIDGIVNKICDYEDFEQGKWLLDEPIKNFTQSIVDDTIKTNAEFQYNAGLGAKIIRRDSGNCCEWCANLAGVYEYPDVPKEVYHRHQRCRCIVDYFPGDGKRQDVWTKKWTDIDKSDKIEERKEFSKTFTGASGAKNYFRDNSFDEYITKEQKRKLNHAYLMYDSIKNSNQKVTKRKIFNNIKSFEEMNDFTKKDVDIAFDHVFNDLHELEKGKMLFEPEYEMAQSWSRLINNNNIQKHDLILLKHERMEHDLMYKKGLNYQEAHDETTKIYFYNPVRKEDK